MRFVGLVLLMAACAALSVRPCAAQQSAPVVNGSDDHRAVRMARAILARGNYVLIQRDTVLTPEFRAAGDLVITSGDVRLEGVIEGQVALLGGALFVRPNARVEGEIVIVDGGAYPSGLASVGEIVRLPPSAAAVAGGAAADTLAGVGAGAVRPVSVTVVSPPRVRFETQGFFGLSGVAYDRVNGVSLSGSVRYRIRTPTGEAELVPRLSYRSARGAIDGGIQATVPLLPRLALELGAERVVATNDRWVRDDLANTLAAVTFASDLRDYYETDVARVGLRRNRLQPVLEGEFALTPFVIWTFSRDRPLPARRPWALFGGDDDWRDNLAVPELSLGTVTAGTAARWKGQSTDFTGAVGIEQAVHVSDDGDLFTHLVLDGSWTMAGLSTTDGFAVTGHLATSLGGSSPEQRWSFVGGATTLPTVDPAAERGDNVVFVRSVYSRLLPSVALPVVGSPTAELIHAIGTAWTAGGPDPFWRQNLGVGLRLTAVVAALYVDPADTSETAFAVALAIPTF